MTIARIFDGKRMQPELLLQYGERLAVGLAQSHPDEVVGKAYILLDLFDSDVGHLVAVFVHNAVDQHEIPPGGES
jgi:hypothetical protein